MSGQLQLPSFDALPFHLKALPPTLPGERPRATCSECGGCFDAEGGFRRYRKTILYTRIKKSYQSRVCVGCEQERRDAAKQANRWLIKARDTLGRHTRRYNATHNVNLTTKQFSHKFFWIAARIAHDMRHAYENTCCYCWRPYTEMPAGIAAVTLDIRDRSDDPHYQMNVGVCCNTCNTEKGQMTPEQWQRRLQYWKEKQEHDATTGRRRINLPLWGDDGDKA